MEYKRAMHFFRPVLFAAFIAVTGYIAYAWYLSYTGYCFNKSRYLTDQDFIEAAVRSSLFRSSIDPKEESIRNFYKNNPACCAADRKSHMASTWIDKLLGYYYVEVELNYEVKPERVDSSTRDRFRFYSEFIKVSACGKPGSSYGEHTKTLRSATRF